VDDLAPEGRRSKPGPLCSDGRERCRPSAIIRRAGANFETSLHIDRANRAKDEALLVPRGLCSLTRFPAKLLGACGPACYLRGMILVYKILPATNWRDAEASGVFAGAGVDLADGFIHFSTRAQVEETAARYFAGVADLLLVAVDAERLGAALRWEPSRGGDLFPHLYRPLASDEASRVDPLPMRDDGSHDFSGLLA
jgi:uncharacterized protein (DUF952 family)